MSHRHQHTVTSNGDWTDTAFKIRANGWPHRERQREIKDYSIIKVCETPAWLTCHTKDLASATRAGSSGALPQASGLKCPHCISFFTHKVQLFLTVGLLQHLVDRGTSDYLCQSYYKFI